MVSMEAPLNVVLKGALQMFRLDQICCYVRRLTNRLKTPLRFKMVNYYYSFQKL